MFIKHKQQIVEVKFKLNFVFTGIQSDTWTHENNFDLATRNYFSSVAQYKHMKSLKINSGSSRNIKLDKRDRISAKTISHNTKENTKNSSEELSFGLLKLYNTDKNKSRPIIDAIPKWPKFEDLLLSIGVEYDWKSDRWIKIKNKVPKNSKEEFKNFNKHKETIHKHEFKYRSIRITGNKNRKNVIIAVTAIR